MTTSVACSTATAPGAAAAAAAAAAPTPTPTPTPTATLTPAVATSPLALATGSGGPGTAAPVVAPASQAGVTRSCTCASVPLTAHCWNHLHLDPNQRLLTSCEFVLVKGGKGRKAIKCGARCVKCVSTYRSYCKVRLTISPIDLRCWLTRCCCHHSRHTRPLHLGRNGQRVGRGTLPPRGAWREPAPPRRAPSQSRRTLANTDAAVRHRASRATARPQPATA